MCGYCSDSSYVNTAGPSWDYFSPLAWTIVIVLLLTFIIILLAVGLALYEYRRESKFGTGTSYEHENEPCVQNLSAKWVRGESATFVF